MGLSTPSRRDDEFTLPAFLLSVMGVVKALSNSGRCSTGAQLISEAPSCRVAALRLLLEENPALAAPVPPAFSRRDTPGGSLVVLRGRVICHRVLVYDSPTDPTSRRVSHGIEGPVVDPVVRSTETALLHHVAEWLHDESAHQKDNTSRASVELVPFALVDDEQYVYVNVNGRRPPPLQMVHAPFKYVKVPPYPFISSGQVNDQLVRMWNTENCIQIEKEITAIGICRNRDGYLQIESSFLFPDFITEMAKDEIVVDLSCNAKGYCVCAIICGALAVSILGFALYRSR